MARCGVRTKPGSFVDCHVGRLSGGVGAEGGRWNWCRINLPGARASRFAG